MATKKFSDFTDGNEIKLGDQIVGLRSGDNTRFDFPGTGIKDGNGNFIFKYSTAGAAAVNFATILNSLSGQPAKLTTDGIDSDIDFEFDLKGTGEVLVPTPTKGSAATTKDYVDSIANSVTYFIGTRVATDTNFIGTYNNGTAGIGATLTATANGAANIDGVALSTNDLVLFKNQTSTFQNGIYELTTNGTAGTPSIFTRSTLFDEPPEIKVGDSVSVTEGTINNKTIWQQTQTVINIGSDAIIFQISVVGLPSSVTDNALVRFDGTTGRALQEGGVTLNDTDIMSFPATLTDKIIFFPNGGGNLDYKVSSITSTLLFNVPVVGSHQFTANGLNALKAENSGVTSTITIGSGQDNRVIFDGPGSGSYILDTVGTTLMALSSPVDMYIMADNNNNQPDQKIIFGFNAISTGGYNAVIIDEGATSNAASATYTFSATSVATSATVASAKFAGGVGIAQNLWVGTDFNLDGTMLTGTIDGGVSTG